MTSPIDGLPLRYLIALDSDPGVAGTATMVGYDATTVPGKGVAAGYINVRQQAEGRVPGVDYIDPPDDIEQEYGEPAFVFGTAAFWNNFDTQVAKWKALGILYHDVDNLDTYNVEQMLEVFDGLRVTGLSAYVKNPQLVKGQTSALLKHSAAVAILCEHDENLTAKKLHDMRVAAGVPAMPIRVATHGDQRSWAEDIARQATDLKLKDFGVTFSPTGEYATCVDILRPIMTDAPIVPTSPNPWLETLDDDIGRYHDGPDVPMLAQQVGRTFPTHAEYAAVAGTGTAWCGIYCAYKLSRYGIEPPYDGKPGVNSWMYVDSWLKLRGGTRLEPSQKRDGDLALWLTTPHHISFCYQGKYLGGNQSNTVNISTFRTPDAIIRPPAPENYVPQPEQMPMLMIESNGDAVRTLQTMLNAEGASLDVDGEFGPDTETAVKDYQSKHGLEVDGIVGPATWASLFDSAPPIEPKPPGEYLLSPEEIAEITRMAGASAIARYSWKDRGKAPLGYTKGWAVMFAQCMRKLEANDSAVLVMSQPIGTSSKDALSHYTISATGRQNVLRKLFVLLCGLGMRESSGNYTEGRDMSASNVTADTAEAGLYQQSWNSSSASSEMKKLLPAYQDNKQPCYSNIFKEGITLKNTSSFGSGPGLEFQQLAKTCPAFASEMAAVGLRVLYNHWGPVVRQEVEMRAEAEVLLVQIEAYLQTQPIPPPVPGPEPEPPLTDLGKAKRRAMIEIEEAVDVLIADVIRIGGGSTQVSANGTGFVMPNIPPQLTNTAIRFAWPYIQQLSADEVVALKDKVAAGQFGFSDLMEIVSRGGGGGGFMSLLSGTQAQEVVEDEPGEAQHSGGGIMASDQLWMNIRYALIIAGTAMLVKYSGGLFSQESAEAIITPLVGGLVGAVAVWWGNYVRKDTKAVPIEDAKSPNVHTVSPVTGAVEPGSVYK